MAGETVVDSGVTADQSWNERLDGGLYGWVVGQAG